MTGRWPHIEWRAISALCWTPRFLVQGVQPGTWVTLLSGHMGDTLDPGSGGPGGGAPRAFEERLNPQGASREGKGGTGVRGRVMAGAERGGARGRPELGPVRPSWLLCRIACPGTWVTARY